MTSAAQRRRPGQAGMTLIEILVAVGLMGLLAAAMVTALAVGSGSWQDARTHLTLDRRIASANEIFYAEFEGVVPITTMSGPQGDGSIPSAAFFQGEPEALRFVGSYSLTEGTRNGLRIVEMQITSTTKGRRILLNERPFRNPLDLNSMILGSDIDPRTGGRRLIFAPIQAQASSLIIADELSDCRFSYLELARSRMDVATWQSYWTDMSRLPGAIRLEMNPRNKAGLRPVTITAPIHARFSAATGGR